MDLKKFVSAIALASALAGCNGVTMSDAKVTADTKVNLDSTNNIDVSGSHFNFDLKSLSGIVEEVINDNATIITENGDKKVLDIENLPESVKETVVPGKQVNINKNEDSVDIQIDKNSFKRIKNLSIEENQGSVSFVINESYSVTGIENDKVIGTNQEGKSIALDSDVIGDVQEGSNFIIRKNKGKVDLKIGDKIIRNIGVSISDNEGNVSFVINRKD